MAESRLFKTFGGFAILPFALVFLAALTGPALAAKLDAETDPRDFYPASAFLDKAAMQQILQDGAIWCMQPQAGTCGFLAEMISADGDDYFYDVVEKWDADTILGVRVKGTLRDDGALCELTTAEFDEMWVANADREPLKEKRVAAIRKELQEIWADFVGVEYCYFYAVTDPRDPDVITQFMYEDGAYIDNPMNMRVDQSGAAPESFVLRDY